MLLNFAYYLPCTSLKFDGKAGIAFKTSFCRSTTGISDWSALSFFLSFLSSELSI